jgi:hypothetical protein
VGRASLEIAAALAVALASSSAAAEIPLVDYSDWHLSIDGRLNAFASYSFGDAQPISVPTWQGIEDRSAGTGSIAMTRIRSGFISNVLGFTVERPLFGETKLKGRFAMWVGVSQTRSKADNPSIDARDVYWKLQGPWGGLLAGRTLALFSRGAIMLDYDIEHAYGLGHPCSIRTVIGAACGHAGHGLLFPGYNAGIVYDTPEVAGFALSVGAFDPASNSERTYERTPAPRFEGEATFHYQKYVRVFFGGLWQKFGNNTDPDQNADAIGFNYGVGATLGVMQIGFTSYAGRGFGLYQPLENSPLFSDDAGVLRKSHGFLGLASLTFGDTKIAGGYGLTVLSKTVNEPAGPFPSQTVPKQQAGLSFGAYQTIKGYFVVAAEYFKGTYDWYPLTDTNGGPPLENRQVVHFINVGGTVFF